MKITTTTTENRMHAAIRVFLKYEDPIFFFDVVIKIKKYFSV